MKNGEFGYNVEQKTRLQIMEIHMNAYALFLWTPKKQSFSLFWLVYVLVHAVHVFSF